MYLKLSKLKGFNDVNDVIDHLLDMKCTGVVNDISGNKVEYELDDLVQVWPNLRTVIELNSIITLQKAKCKRVSFFNRWKKNGKLDNWENYNVIGFSRSYISQDYHEWRLSFIGLEIIIIKPNLL